MTLEPTLQGTNLIADDPVLQHFTCELRDDEYVATASGSGSGLLEHDREGGRYLGRGAGALFVCEAEDSQVGRYRTSQIPEHRPSPLRKNPWS
jgi:hypothetical protein